jgi:hypothetical protein
MDFIPSNLNALYSRLQSESELRSTSPQAGSEITRDNFMIVSEVRSKPSEILLSPSVGDIKQLVIDDSGTDVYLL